MSVAPSVTGGALLNGPAIAVTDPGGTSDIPTPMAIEHPDPGGVSCTTRG